MAAQPTEQHLNPLAVLSTLEKILPDNAILVADGGDFVGSAAYILKPRGPLAWLDPGAFGTLGVGGGFALGAKLARPDSEVWIIWGDGSCAYSLAEFDTLSRFNLPVMALVGNDAGWTQILREQAVIFGTEVACKLVVSFHSFVSLSLSNHYLTVILFILAYGLSRRGQRIWRSWLSAHKGRRRKDQGGLKQSSRGGRSYGQERLDQRPHRQNGIPRRKHFSVITILCMLS